MNNIITDNENNILLQNKLMEIHLVCTKCNKFAGMCYVPEITFSKTLGWDFLCEVCKNE